MKKVILILTVLGTLSLASCKKAYNCTCTQSSTSTASVIAGGTADASDVALINASNATYNAKYPDTHTSVSTTDKTTKANVNATCTKTVNTEVQSVQDYADYDGDHNTNEVAYQETNVSTTDCSAAKK